MDINVREAVIDRLTTELYHPNEQELMSNEAIDNIVKMVLAGVSEDGTYCADLKEYQKAFTFAKKSGETDYLLLQCLINELIDSTNY